MVKSYRVVIVGVLPDANVVLKNSYVLIAQNRKQALIAAEKDFKSVWSKRVEFLIFGTVKYHLKKLYEYASKKIKTRKKETCS